MNLLKLPPEAIDIVSKLGDPIFAPIAVERRLRPLLALSAEQQKAQIANMLTKGNYDLP